MKRIGILIAFTLLQLLGFSQEKLIALLKSKSWMYDGMNLTDIKTLSGVEIEKARNKFTFKNKGEIEYEDMLKSYDPSEGCSHSFMNYTGKWVTWKGEIFLTLHYNSFSAQPFLVDKYKVKYLSENELTLIRCLK
ncbi:MAG: hypothetical protein K0S32_1945 [Bacteroidetes bacterium]|jgi:hypothetical protein|nr:hypothetical protein [Bacteroidota bacterium]